MNSGIEMIRRGPPRPAYYGNVYQSGMRSTNPTTRLSASMEPGLVTRTVGEPLVAKAMPFLKAGTLFQMAIMKHSQERGISQHTARNQLSKAHIEVIKSDQPRRTKNNLLPTSTKGMVARKYTKKKRTTKKKKISTGFPKRKLVRLTSYHLGSLDGGASGATSLISINANNPLDPIDDSDSVTFTLTSSERHPKHWEQYEKLYENYEVLKTKASVKFISTAVNSSSAYFMVPANSVHATEVKAICQDTVTFSTRLKDAVKGTSIKWNSATLSGSSGHGVVNMSKTVSPRKIEDHTAKTDGSLVGITDASGTATAPASISKIYCGYGGLNTADLNAVQVVIKLEYDILFTGLPDKEGVAISA